jgi:hypothetical protein
MDKFSGVITEPDSESLKSEIMNSLVQPEIHTGSIQRILSYKKKMKRHLKLNAEL